MAMAILFHGVMSFLSGLVLYFKSSRISSYKKLRKLESTILLAKKCNTDVIPVSVSLSNTPIDNPIRYTHS